MFNKKIAVALIAQSLLVGSLWAKTDKACLRAANKTYKTDIAACKELKGDEKKTCKKTAKENKAQAVSACKAPVAH